MNTATQTDTPTVTTLAEQYNTRIARSLSMSEALFEYVESYHAGTLNEDDPADAVLYGTEIDRDTFVAELAELGNLDELDPSEVMSRWFVDALAVEATGRYNGYVKQWTVESVEVTVTSGGPNTWIVCREGVSGAVTVNTAWGNDTASCRVYAPALANICSAWADDQEEAMQQR